MCIRDSLILEVGGEAERLTKVLLVQTAVRPGQQLAVKSLYDQARTTGCGHELDGGCRQAASCGQAHAEVLVRRERLVFAVGQLGLEDVAARHAVKRLA